MTVATSGAETTGLLFPVGFVLLIL